VIKTIEEILAPKPEAARIPAFMYLTDFRENTLQNTDQMEGWDWKGYRRGRPDERLKSQARAPAVHEFWLTAQGGGCHTSERQNLTAD